MKETTETVLEHVRDEPGVKAYKIPDQMDVGRSRIYHSLNYLKAHGYVVEGPMYHSDGARQLYPADEYDIDIQPMGR